MITSSLVRATRSVCCSITSASPATRSRTISEACHRASTSSTSKVHQRRLSSSKASIPPNGPARPRSSVTSSQKSVSSSGRSRGRKAKAPDVEDGFSHLPKVPSTEHLHIADINVSSFFSLHRPISVTTTIPPIISHASFSDLFENRPEQPLINSSGDVIQTLGSAVTYLESLSAEEQPQDESVPTSGPPGIPRDISYDSYRPFQPPPVPKAASKSRKAAGAVESFKRPKRAANSTNGNGNERAWTTTITVTEQITPTGKRIYSAESTPLEQVEHLEPGVLIEQPNIMIEPVGELVQVPFQQPFLQRMRTRQLNWEETKREKMVAISVKRQRKLKMKKHKYKKLMKRTRNQRRKLGKI